MNYLQSFLTSLSGVLLITAVISFIVWTVKKIGRKPTKYFGWYSVVVVVVAIVIWIAGNPI